MYFKYHHNTVNSKMWNGSCMGAMTLTAITRVSSRKLSHIRRLAQRLGDQ